MDAIVSKLPKQKQVVRGWKKKQHNNDNNDDPNRYEMWGCKRMVDPMQHHPLDDGRLLGSGPLRVPRGRSLFIKANPFGFTTSKTHYAVDAKEGVCPTNPKADEDAHNSARLRASAIREADPTVFHDESFLNPDLVDNISAAAVRHLVAAAEQHVKLVLHHATQDSSIACCGDSGGNIFQIHNMLTAPANPDAALHSAFLRESSGPDCPYSTAELSAVALLRPAIGPDGKASVALPPPSRSPRSRSPSPPPAKRHRTKDTAAPPLPPATPAPAQPAPASKVCHSLQRLGVRHHMPLVNSLLRAASIPAQRPSSGVLHR